MFAVNRYIPGQDAVQQQPQEVRLRQVTACGPVQHDRPTTALAEAADSRPRKSERKQKKEKKEKKKKEEDAKPKSKKRSRSVPAAENDPDEPDAVADPAVPEPVGQGDDALPGAEPEPGASPGPVRSPWLRSDRVVLIPDTVPDLSLDGLRPALAACLRDRFRITSLFPLQSFLIRSLQRDRRLRIDSCISSRTGSGKTLCFALPILQQLADRVVTRLRALILVPTRDLALQLRDVIGVLSEAVGLRTGLAIGQRSFEFEQGELTAGSGIDILICTPGRLTDHLQLTPGFTLQHLEFLVLDEADRLFGQNFQSWEAAFQRGGRPSLRSSPLQTLLFSATMSLNPLSLAKLQLRSPVFYCGSAQNDYACAASLTQQLRVCPEPADKLADLVWLLRRHRSKTIVFLNSLDAAHNLKRTLEICGEFVVDEFHSGLRLKQRLRIMSSFKSGRDHVLICSDMMARGIDIDGVDVVVNYDCPNFLKTYLHRVGRTARANKAGLAVTFCLPHEVRHFRGLLRHAQNSDLEKITIPKQDRHAIQETVRPCIDLAQILFEAEFRHQIDRTEPVRTAADQSLEDIRKRLQKLVGHV